MNRPFCKKLNPRLIEKYRCYSVEGLADVFHVSQSTVLIWISKDLKTIDHQKPYMLFGADIIAWIKTYQPTKKKKPDQKKVYCLKCRDKVPFEYQHAWIETGKKGFRFVQCRCPTCKSLVAFKNYLRDTPSKTTGEPISRSYLWHATRYVKDFFTWLSDDPKYRTKIKKNAIRYFNLSSEDKAIAQATSEREYASVAEINDVIRSIPFNTEVEKRDKALLSLLLLSGARISALISLKVKHVNIKKKFVLQHPKDVNTKGKKRIKTWFFPVGLYAYEVVIEYMRFLGEKGFSSADALFPKNDQSTPQLLTIKLGNTEWKSTSSARKIITGHFVKHGLPAYCPHSFRNSLTQLAYRSCRTPEEFKAWSANLGHKSPRTTFDSYGHIDENRQGDIILGFSQPENENNGSITPASTSTINSKEVQ